MCSCTLYINAPVTYVAICIQLYIRIYIYIYIYAFKESSCNCKNQLWMCKHATILKPYAMDILYNYTLSMDVNQAVFM